MMNARARCFSVGLATAMFGASPALAVSVANQTDKPLEVTADLGANEPKVMVEAGKSAKLDCPEGCEVRVVGLNSYGISAKTGESLVIKDGMLHHGDASMKGASADGKASKK